MDAQVYTPSIGDEVFDPSETSVSTPTKNVAENFVNSSNTYQQTPPSAKHMVSHHNTSDEYYTANEESINNTTNFSMNNSIIQQNISAGNNFLPVGQTGMATPTTGPPTMAARKQVTSMVQNEPAKPLSAYALFFRDTVSAIKQQNPSCSFQELSKIVASMWDALDPVHKGVYNKKNEMARTEYLKQIRIYQQQQQLKQEQLNAISNESLQTETIVQQQSMAQPTTQPVANTNFQQNTEAVSNNNEATCYTTPANSAASANTGVPSDEQMHVPNESEAVQICTRENCNKRAIISPDWEDEYCSNECVIIHCRNVFNAWVQSNFEAKLQQEQQQTSSI